MAGEVKGTGNSNYYLYTNQYYWTMSPYSWQGAYQTPSEIKGSIASVFYVSSSESFSYNDVNSAYGVRPVINLKSDTQFQSGGNGTKDNPYVVQ